MSPQGQEPRQPTPEEQDSLLDELVAVLDIPMTVLALISIALLIIEFTATLKPEVSRTISFVQTIIWALFLVEFALRVFLAENRVRYLKKHWLDALTVFLPALRVLQVVRAFRAIRLLRVVSPSTLARTYFATRRTFNHLGRTLGASSFQYVLLTTVVVIFLGGVGMYLLEQNAGGANIRTYGDAVWYVTGVITTVGNELYPVTAEGRILASVLMVYGVGVFGYLAGTLASYFVQTNVSPQIPVLPGPTPPPREDESAGHE